MEYVNCNLCGCDATEVVNHGPDLLLNRPGDYYLVRCQQCGLIYQNPRLTPAELEQHYPESYLPYQEDYRDASFLQRLSTQHWIQRRCAHLSRHHPGTGHLLDVGCATGLFLDAMRGRGWDVTGVELSRYAAAYARKTFALEVVAGTLQEAQFPGNSFDVVTLWDVLEHVIDPKETLAEIRRVLKADGTLVLSLPNPTCVEAGLFGDSWVGWDRPRHLHLFTPAVLHRYLEEAGFMLTTIESLGGRLGLTLLSVEFLCKKHGVSERRWRSLVRLLYNGPLRLATWPLYRLGEKLNQTTVMTVFARPRESRT